MFLAMRAEVETALADAFDALGYPDDDLGIERPPDDVDAVLASSASYRLAGVAEAPPPAVAGELAEAIDPAAHEYIGDVTTSGAYVNFLPSEQYFAETLATAQAADYGHLADRETSVVLEHTSANPTGPVHIGRARNPIIGDALARVLEYAGYDVERHYYVNDAGRQIAMFTWAYETFDESALPEQGRDSPEYDLTRYYQHGTTYLEEAGPEETEDAETEIQAILQGLEDGDEETIERVGKVVDTVLGGMQRTLDRLPAEFDEFVKETRFMRDGSTDDVVDRLEALDEAVYEEDAWQLDFADIDKNLVFLRSDGTSLYPTRDIAHHEWKLDNFDEAVTVLGEDHKLHDEQITATLDLLGHDTDRIRTVHYSWVDLPEGQLSTRAGADLLLDDLLDEAIDRAREEVEHRLDDRIRDDDLAEADIERIAHQVGIGAVRYDVVSKQPTKGITFEWERALDFEAQSAPYVQYVHARASGIRAEADAADLAVAETELADPAALLESLTTTAERGLLREIARFPAVIEEAAEDLQPHVVATYTRDIAEAFNTFYRECPVLDADEETAQARLALVVAAQTTVGNALDTLGVAAPESM